MNSGSRRPGFYAYSTNYLIDTKAGIIVDVEATAAYRPDEVFATQTMLNRIEERFEIKPQYLIGDTAYGTGENDELNFIHTLAKDKGSWLAVDL